MDLITLLIGALATARLTRLVTTDRITAGPRSAILRRLPDGSLWAYLLVCDWCLSMYLGAGVAAALWAWDWSVWPLAALAFSYMAGWLASKEEE